MAEDRALIAAVARKDKSAMRALYERHGAALLAFLKGRGCDAETAADVAHDAMLDVWRTADRFAGKSMVKTWIFAIARNKLVDRQRRAGRVAYVEEVPEVADDAPSPEAAAIAAADGARLRRCLEGLKPAHHTAIRLAFFEDLTYDEIGALEEVPVGTVKTRIFHAKQALLRCLGRR